MKPRLAWILALSVATLANALLSGDQSSPSAQVVNSQRRPVVVELFTSEGCSSCPPADDLLAGLEKNQPVRGAEIIVLSEHVDYWNHLGWVDPFSSAEFSARQSKYAEIFRQGGVYTPQMIVDGRIGFVGSDTVKARDAIAQAAQSEKATVQIALSPDWSGLSSGGGVPLRVRIENLTAAFPRAPIDLLLVITESNLNSKVTRGENAGRKLNHTSVVRKMRVIGKVDPYAPGDFATELIVPIEKRWKRQNLRVVVLVQDRESGRVFGAASARLAD